MQENHLLFPLVIGLGSVFQVARVLHEYSIALLRNGTATLLGRGLRDTHDCCRSGEGPASWSGYCFGSCSRKSVHVLV